MKNIIYKKLNVLKNFKFQYIARAANMLVLGFGELDISKNANFHLHIQCPWRIIEKNKIVLASNDIFIPNSHIKYNEDFDWDIKGNNMFDEKSIKIINPDSLAIVTNITTDEYGSFQISFDNSQKLQVFTNISIDKEEWRFFNKFKKENHFVVYGNGYEEI